jgi:chromate reductase
MTHIAYIIGSVSAHSINRQVAEAMVAVASPTVQMTEIPIAELPFYDEAHDQLPAAQALRQAIHMADGVVLFTPEHNRSTTAVMKNAVDFASRPRGENAWLGKPVAITGATRGAVGTAVAQPNLRGILPILGATVMGRPEMYVSLRPNSFDANGDPEPGLATILRTFIEQFETFVAVHAG